MPCPHFHVEMRYKYTGNSALANIAYCMGEPILCYRTGEWIKANSNPDRVLYNEVMLPTHAPPEFSDRTVLWNSADEAETQANGQVGRAFEITLPRELTFEQNLELARAYCQKYFVDQGMCCDFFYHEDGRNHNPHFHCLVTTRPMDENGKWLSKVKMEYVLDDNGERIRLPSGSWKRKAVPTVDWNNRSNCEMWRHGWEVMQNEALEKAGRVERVDMRSYKRQGVDRAPGVHLGAAASAMERKGIRTERGNLNRENLSLNRRAKDLERSISALSEWLDHSDEFKQMRDTLLDPNSHSLMDVVTANMNFRRKYRRDTHFNKGAQLDSDKKEFQALARVYRFLREQKINTLPEYNAFIEQERPKAKNIRSDIAKIEREISNQNALLDADKTLSVHADVWKQYKSNSFKKMREAYKAKHADEITACEKASKLLTKFGMTHPIDRRAVKGNIKKLEQQRNEMTKELRHHEYLSDELKEIRTILRQAARGVFVVPNIDDRTSVVESMEDAQEHALLVDDVIRAQDELLTQRPSIEEEQDDKK